jgi:hypothetical protein
MLRPCLFVVAASAFAGCLASSGDEGFVVLNASAAGSASCSFTGDPAQPFIARGAIDAYSPIGYQLFPLMKSRVSALVGEETQKTIELHGGRVDLSIASATVTDAQGHLSNVTITLDPGVSHFKQLVAGSLTPLGSANVDIEIIPSAALAQIASQITTTPSIQIVVLASLVMYGDLGGGEVDALPFKFPVSIAAGSAVNVLGTCPKTAVNKGNACNPFQDGIIDCCTDATTNKLVCPAK